MYDTVLAALRRGAADEALGAARELVEAKPGDIRALRLFAAAQRLSGDHAASLATLDAALEREPDDADLHLERAGLLLQAHDLDRAQAALARSIGLDPNQFPAYILQAQLALGRGELDEAERLVRTASRLAPEHPHVHAIDGMVALHRGRPDHALEQLSAAARLAPDETVVRNALGFAYLANGHLAFAEQAFRGVLQVQPDNRPLKALVARIVRQQGRPGDAANELQPLLEDPATGPAMHRFVGELDVEAGRFDAALPRLKHALALLPGDRRTLSALLEVWQRQDAPDDARSTLDAALATHPQEVDLWLSRLAIEPFAGEAARAVIERWIAAMPDHVPALAARMTALDAVGDAEGAEAAARRIVEIEPGQTQAEMRLLDALMAREPEAAVCRVVELEDGATDPAVKRWLRQLRGFALDRADRQADAVDIWLSLHAEAAAERLPLPAATGHAGPWPEAAPMPPDPAGLLWLWGAPGSMVERIAHTFHAGAAPLLADRLGPRPPSDPLQRFDSASQIVDGRLAAAYLAAQWRAALPGRGATGPNVFDWQVHWDNAYALALRPHLPEVMLMVALRDPRDMLLDWLAFGSPVPLRFESPLVAAQWLAASLAQVADLHEQDLVPHRLVRLDGIESQPQALAQALSDALRLQVPVPPPDALGPPRLPAGHWQRFAGVLDDAFSALGPVAARLGYTA